MDTHLREAFVRGTHVTDTHLREAFVGQTCARHTWMAVIHTRASSWPWACKVLAIRLLYRRVVCEYCHRAPTTRLRPALDVHDIRVLHHTAEPKGSRSRCAPSTMPPCASTPHPTPAVAPISTRRTCIQHAPQTTRGCFTSNPSQQHSQTSAQNIHQHKPHLSTTNGCYTSNSRHKAQLTGTAATTTGSTPTGLV